MARLQALHHIDENAPFLFTTFQRVWPLLCLRAKTENRFHLQPRVSTTSEVVAS